MTKPNNSWEIEFDNILGNRKDIIDQLVGRIPDEKVIEGLKYFDETRRQLTELFSKTLQQQREDILEEITNLVKENRKGSFTDDGGNDCWYIDDLVKELKILENKIIL